jgi:cytochrome c oxidase cbb3-type subunit 4
MDLEAIRGLGTAFLLCAYLALCVWAFLPRNRRRFEEDARLPFRDDGEPGRGR